MIQGIANFTDYFTDYSEDYVVIGGLATAMVMNDFQKLLELISNAPKGKACTTKFFYDYIFSLDDTGTVFENLEPIHKIKIFMTQTSASVKFEDKLGNGTNFQGQNVMVGFII